MENKLEINIGDKKIVALINDWNDELPKELCVCLCTQDDAIIQDICMVREHYSYDNKKFEFKIDSNFIDCKVWGDSDNEDYTDDFVIGVYDEEEED